MNANRPLKFVRIWSGLAGFGLVSDSAKKATAAIHADQRNSLSVVTQVGLIFLSVIVLGAGAVTAEALAAGQEPKKSESAKMDRARVMSLLPTGGWTDADLARDYVNQRITPMGDPKLYFEIPVHKSWNSRPFEVDKRELANDDKGLVPLARITPNNEDEGVVLEVRYMRVPEKATLEKFLEQYPKAAGFTVLGRQKGEYNGRIVEEALLRMDTKDFGPMLTRLAATRKGDRILVVAGSAPEKKYEKMKNIFAVAIIGFDPDATPPKR